MWFIHLSPSTPGTSAAAEGVRLLSCCYCCCLSWLLVSEVAASSLSKELLLHEAWDSEATLHSWFCCVLLSIVYANFNLIALDSKSTVWQSHSTIYSHILYRYWNAPPAPGQIFVCLFSICIAFISQWIEKRKCLKDFEDVSGEGFHTPIHYTVVDSYVTLVSIFKNHAQDKAIVLQHVLNLSSDSLRGRKHMLLHNNFVLTTIFEVAN